MAEYEIRFSKARQARGLPCYAVMKFLGYERFDNIEMWSGVSAHKTEEEAQAALAALTKDGD